MSNESPHFLLINKPAGWTSFDVVNYIRKKIKIETNNKNIKVGHAGTLDPFATGLLIVGIGREATKRLDEFKNLPKSYLATIHLGATSDTHDVTGTIEKELATNKEQPSLEVVKKIVMMFVGKQQQIPPMFSAKKINGQRLYKLARQGKTVERKPVEIEILDIKILGYTYPFLKIEVTCSAGTYIRSLADDIGKKLGTGAYCEELTRTKIGEYKLENAKPIDELG
jgi:tRNA pseudouridine55 synthase